ncbi:unnamed protein product [Caenorhabditis bovis]|uniref:Protein aurora borealis n=1 Tax=Caenorhabditis bovis TaxID=2654633 RepID=A0A8S1EVR4_9PELO|nr:unnamed protein product [Caenorhabditis bovis]
MELNVSSFYDGEDTNQTTKNQLNSTALDNENSDDCSNQQKGKWKLSPIVAEESRRPIFKKQGKTPTTITFKTPLKTQDLNKQEDAGYDSKCTTEGENNDTSCSTPSRNNVNSSMSLATDLSSLIASNSLNPFDSIIINSLHKCVNFSPRVVFSQEGSSSSENQQDEKFQWSVEQLAVLKPAHITEDEIAASYHSPVPELEEKVQEVLNVYWSQNVSYIPSPDGPRYVHLPHRNGNTTTIVYGPEGTVSAIRPQQKQELTPSLSNIVRKREAAKAAYATSSPKQRPIKRNIKTMRTCNSQTEITIPPNADIDLKKILGDEFIHQASDDADAEEIFDVSMSSNFSMRRRLFSSSNDDNEEADASMNSCDDSQRFNDSLSPVPSNNDESIVPDEQKSSQIAINISILNDCMMQSMEQCENSEDNAEDNKENDENRTFHNDRHISYNEYEMLDKSSSSEVTPRHEDLDWTPRRVEVKQSRFRDFMLELSPIVPKIGQNSP